MAKLHELLAAEKTPTSAWNQLYEETLKKFGNISTFFQGHSQSLSMIEDTEANKAIEAQAREEKPVTTNVYETLEYVFDIFGKAEDLQFQKNATNRIAVGTVMWRGNPMLVDMPIDELLGLEDRLKKIRELFMAMPTLDASKHWKIAEQISKYVWEFVHPEVKTKTKKIQTPIVLAEATKEHPAQVQLGAEDVVVGKVTLIGRSGCATSIQKAEAIKRIDELMIEVKQARMRANETQVVAGSVAKVLVPFLLEPLKNN